MPQVGAILRNKTKIIQTETGSNLMKSLLDAGLPVASSCNAEGVCGKCRIEVVTGLENLSAKQELELFLIEKYQLKNNERISCQCQVLGDVSVQTKYW